jgi:phage terminase large subunit-like protein
MVRADPELAAKLKIVDSSKTIINYANGSVYRAISAEAGTKHGLNPSMVIYDELAQAKSRALYDVLDTSMGAREEPLMIVISTQSNDPQHLTRRSSVICTRYRTRRASTSSTRKTGTSRTRRSAISAG